MKNTNPKVDAYLIDGCGRCPLGGTPQCKVHNWPHELDLLRQIVLECGLIEELKWGVPCYTFPFDKSAEKKQNANILILSAFKQYCALSFFKGTLLNDSKGKLTAPGENSQSARLLKFTSVQEIKKLVPYIKTLIEQAVALEKQGVKVAFKKADDFIITEEFKLYLNENAALKKAFFALTPGRQRGYLLHFDAAKQTKTRMARIEKCIPLILAGKGIFD